MSKAEDLIQRGLNKIPGYKGYRDKEDRRDEDKRVRESVADALGAQIDALTRYNAELANARDFDALSALEQAIGQVRLLADRVRHASYGYGGIFSDTDVNANALEQLRLFDSALLRETGSLAAAVSKLTSTTPPDLDAKSAVTAEINRLSALFDSRGAVIETARPNDDEETLQLLALPEKVDPSPLLEVTRGDALSVLGDNFIANGVITLKTNDGVIILARVSTEASGATWLLGSTVAGINSARLTESGSAGGGFQTMVSATASIDTIQGQEENVQARYSYRVLGDNRVEFALAFGDTIREYSGTTIVDKDIEVYGLS